MENLERVVTVYSTKGQNKLKVTTSAITWGDLSSVIGKDFDLKSLHATENINRTDLVSSEAILPKGDFILFLRPKQTKAGVDASNMDYKTLRATIKEEIAVNGDEARNHFNSGKNHTNKSTEELRIAVASWFVLKNESTNNVVSNVIESFTTLEQLNEIQKLVDVINTGGEYIVEFSFKEGCDEDCQEDIMLKEEANKLLGTFK